MNMLDMRTVFVANIFTFSICTVMVALLWQQSRRRYAGMIFLVADFSLQTIAVLLIALRGAIPDLLSISLANILVLAGSILGYMGLQRFVGRRGSQLHNYFLLAVFSILLILLPAASSNMTARNFAVSLGLLIVWLQCFWLMMYQVAPDLRPLTRGVGIAFGALCLVNIMRIGYYMVGFSPMEVDFLKTGGFHVFVIIAYQMLLIILTYSLALMVNKRLFADLKVQEEKFAKAFHSSPNAIVLSRVGDAKILEVNDGFVNITGYRAEEIRGKTALELNIWEDEEEREAVIAEISRNGRVHNRELKFRNKSGATITGLLAAEVITIDGEKCLLTSVSDISERKRMEEEIRELSLRDPLTGLYNRRGFFTIAEQEMKTARRTGKRLCLTFIDCDGLKTINDTFGHEEGDRALMATAGILCRTFRTSDVIARMGGDEFAVFSTDATDIDPKILTRRLQASIETYNEENPVPWRLSMSWGVAVSDPAGPLSLDELIAAADSLMYREKKAKVAAGI